MAKFNLIVDVLLCSLIVSVTCAIYFSGAGASMALNSDIVMPYVMYTDAVAGKNLLSGWLMPEAPYWFPDLVLTWLIYAGTSLRSAVNIFAFVQVSSYLLLAYGVMRLIDLRRASVAWRIFLLLWLGIFLISAQTHSGWFENFHQYIFVPYTHGSALLLTLASLGLILQLQRTPDNIAPFIVLILLSVGTVLSDRLYALECLLPLLAITATTLLPTRLRVRLAAALSLILVSTELWRWGTATAALTSRYAPESSAALSATQMMRDLSATAQSSIWVSVIELGGCLALLSFLIQSWRTRRVWRAGENTAALPLVSVFIALSILLPFLASIALGRHLAPDNFRYEQTLGFTADSTLKCNTC